MAKKSPYNIVTANLLLEGDSVFLSDKGWTTDHRCARIANGPEEAVELEALAQQDEAANKVVGVYLVAVQIEADGRPEPIHYREKMRVRAQPSFWSDTPKSRSAPRAHGDYGEVRHVSV